MKPKRTTGVSALAQHYIEMGMALSTHYILPEEQRCKTVRIGKRVLPMETPEEHKARLYAMQHPEAGEVA